MSGLMKELLLDYAMNKVSTDLRTDITTAIANLQSARSLSNTDIHILNTYLMGYTANEIAAALYKSAEDIESTLYRIVKAIEYASGYTDNDLVTKITRQGYARSKVAKFEIFIDKHGKEYRAHDL